MTTSNTARSPKVILITPWYGGNEGGVAVVTESLVRSLLKAGTPCAVIELMSDGWTPQTRLGPGGETIVRVCLRDRAEATGLVSRAGAVVRDVLATRAFKALLPTDGRGCVAHFHYTAPQYDLLVKLCQRWRIPVVSTFHGGDLMVNLQNARTYSVAKSQVKQSGAVTAVSHSLRNTALEFFPGNEARISVIYNAVPPDFAAAVQQTSAENSRDIDVLYVGNLIARKGVDVLLRAWAIVQRARPASRLILAGAGEELTRLQSLASELGITDSVEFAGRKSRAELPALYERAVVLAVPSRAEPLGVVILEGALSGAAIVASNVGGIPELVQHGANGLLVPADDPEKLGGALLQLLDDPTYRTTLTADGARRVREQFTAEHIGGQYRALYEQVIRAGGVSRPT